MTQLQHQIKPFVQCNVHGHVFAGEVRDVTGTDTEQAYSASRRKYGHEYMPVQEVIAEWSNTPMKVADCGAAILADRDALVQLQEAYVCQDCDHVTTDPNYDGCC